MSDQENPFNPIEPLDADLENDELEDQDPVLEEPEASEIPDAGIGTLFSDDVPNLASKLLALESMYKLLTANLGFHDFMREILLTIMKAVKCEAGSILEINHKEKTIFFRAAVGHSSDQVIRFVIPLGKGIVGYVAESKQHLVVSDAEGNEQHLKTIANAVGFNVRNIIALPIIIRGRVFAVLELLNRIGEKNFTEPDIELLRSLCETAARAIEIRLMIAWSQKPDVTNEDAA